MSFEVVRGRQLHAAQGGAEKKGAAKNNAKPAENPGKTFDRAKFFKDSGSGIQERGRILRWSEKVGFKEVSDKVVIPEATERQYRIFLRNHYENLAQLNTDAPEVLSDPRHKYDRLLFDAMKGEGGQMNENNLEKFLAQPRGWEITTLLLDHQIALRDMAHGVMVQAKRDSIRDPLHMPGGKATVADIQALTHLGFGEKLDRLRARKFEAIKGDALESKYLKVMTGVDVDDFQVAHGSADVSLIPGRNRTSSTSAEKLDAEQKSLRRTRRFFLKDGLGVKDRYLDASAEEWLMKKHRPLDGLRMYDSIFQRFNDPDFNPLNPGGGLTLSDTANVENWMKAREAGLSEMMEGYLDNLSMSPDVKQMKEKLDAVTAIANGEAAQKLAKTGALEAKKTAIEGDQQRVTKEGGIQQRFIDVKKQADAVAEARKKAAENGVASGSLTDIETELETSRKHLEGRAKGTGAYLVSSLKGQLLAVQKSMPVDVEAEVTATMAALGIGLRDPAYKSRRAIEKSAAEDAYKAAHFVPLETAITEQTARITKLTEAQTAIQKAQEGLKPGGEKAKAYDQANTDMVDAWTKTTAIRTTPPLVVDEALLRSGKTVDEIMETINSVYEATKASGTPLGWAKELNGTEGRRHQVMRAMAQAKLNDTMGTYATTHIAEVADRIDLTDIAGVWRLTDGELLGMSKAELSAEMAKPTHLGHALNPAEELKITNAQEAAKERLKLAAEAHTWMNEQFGGKAADLADQIVVLNATSEPVRAKAILEISARKDVMKESAANMILNKGEYTDRTASDVVTGPVGLRLSPEERAAKVPMGYLKAMQDWFKYQTGVVENNRLVKSRGKRFEEIYEAMPPAKYAELMNRHLGFGVPEPRPTASDAQKARFVNVVLARMDREIGTNINITELRRAPSEIIEQLFDETIATAA